MTPNELLIWLSARGEGSWPQFRGAIETLDLANSSTDEAEDAQLSLHQRVRFNLERLGHVEFDTPGSEDRWRVVPPALAICDHGQEAMAVLCGARTPKLLESIEQEAQGLIWQRTAVTDCPDIIRIHAPESRSLEELAQQTGIRCQPDAPAALLSHLPLVDSLGGSKPEDLPAAGNDWDVKQFVIEKKRMRWQPITLREANAPRAEGLFCFTRFQIPHYFLRERNRTVRVPGAIGKYRMLDQYRRRVLRYARKEQQLAVPAIFRPPVLTERAIVLCSGFPPSLTSVRGRRWLTYEGVPEDIAGMVAEVLRQDLL
jgi:hypothetical protein